jgi:predicted permease
MSYFRSVAAKFFHRSRVEEEMEQELHAHIAHRADDLERSGISRREAERRARVEFGGRERFKDECREAWGGNFIETLVQDLRLSARVLRKSPGFTTVAVLTLALAVGANAVVFAVLNAAILRPLNLPRAKSLWGLFHGSDGSGFHTGYVSYPAYVDLRDRNRTFDDLAAFNATLAGFDTGGNPIRSWGVNVSGNYFDVMGVQPYLGRFFHASDEHGPNSAPYLVLGYGFWHSHFQDGRNVVGRVVRLNKHPFTVIGVAPPEFHGTLLFFYPDYYLPMVNQQQLDGASALDSRGNPWVFLTLGHLKPGVTPAQAVADLNSIGTYLQQTYPKFDNPVNVALGRPGLYGDFLGGPVRAFVTGLMLLAGLILLAACANLGNLFAARASDRAREVALRLALGSSRNRILRSLFTEAVIISVVGGAVGLWGTVMLLRVLSTWRPIPKYPIQLPLSPDANVYAAALGLAAVSGILFGIVPVRQVLRTDPYQIVKSGERSTSGRRIAMRDLLLVGQIAICAVLVTSSLVGVRGLERSLDSKFGFQPQNAMLMDTSLDMAGYKGDQVTEMQKRMTDAMEAIPGVSAVGLTDRQPLNGGDWATKYVFTDETADLTPAKAAAEALIYDVSPGYFRAAGTSLVAGREFSRHDDKGAPPVAVVNREFARKIFGSPASAMDRHYKLKDGTRVQVVGIAEDGKYKGLTEAPQPAMFFPLLQEPSSETWMVVRSTRDPQQLAAAMQRTLRGLDAELPYFMQTWDRELDEVLFPARVATMSLGVLGLMGAMLSITGIFGMAAYSVSRRLRELGIRMALGAQRAEVLQAALGRAVRLLALGSATGLGLGILASRVLSAIVYMATPRDPLVVGGVVLAMMSLGLLATWIPAQKALSVDASTLLREQ